MSTGSLLANFFLAIFPEKSGREEDIEGRQDMITTSSCLEMGRSGASRKNPIKRKSTAAVLRYTFLLKVYRCPQRAIFQGFLYRFSLQRRPDGGRGRKKHYFVGGNHPPIPKMNHLTRSKSTLVVCPKGKYVTTLVRISIPTLEVVRIGRLINSD